MQGENLRVGFRGHKMGSGREMLTEKLARLLMKGLQNDILRIRANRLGAELSASRGACGFLALMVAPCNGVGAVCDVRWIFASSGPGAS
jgi:hypothetical protein